MGTTCAPLVADVLFTATKRISWILLTKQADIIEALNSTSRYHEDILNIGFLSVAWPTGVQLVFFFCFGF